MNYRIKLLSFLLIALVINIQHTHAKQDHAEHDHSKHDHSKHDHSTQGNAKQDNIQQSAISTEYTIGPSIQYYHSGGGENSNIVYQILFGMTLGITNKIHFNSSFFVQNVLNLSTFIKQIEHGKYDGLEIDASGNKLKYFLKSRKNIQTAWALRLGMQFNIFKKSSLEISLGVKSSFSGHSIRSMPDSHLRIAPLLNDYWNNKINGYQNASIAYPLSDTIEKLNSSVKLADGKLSIVSGDTVKLPEGTKFPPKGNVYNLQFVDDPLMSRAISDKFRKLDLKGQGLRYSYSKQDRAGHIWSLGIGPSASMMFHLPKSGSLSVSVGAVYDAQFPVYQFHADESVAFLPQFIDSDKISIKPDSLRIYGDSEQLGTGIRAIVTEASKFDTLNDKFRKDQTIDIKNGPNKGVKVIIKKDQALPLKLPLIVSKKDQKIHIRYAKPMIIAKNRKSHKDKPYNAKDVAGVLFEGAQKVYKSISKHVTHNFSIVVSFKY